jgi:hypothetical protein
MAEYVCGLDLGQAQDYTALAVAEILPIATGRTRLAVDGRSVPGPRPHEWLYERTEREVPITEDHYHLRDLRRWPLNTSYPTIVRDVAALLDREPLCSATTTLAIDYGGVGRPVLDMFDGAALICSLVPVTIHGGDAAIQDGRSWRVPKRDLIAATQVALQRGRLKVAPALSEAVTLTRELSDYRVKISASGHDSYDAREGQHDDLVLAVALAVWVAEHGRVPEYFAV